MHLAQVVENQSCQRKVERVAEGIRDQESQGCGPQKSLHSNSGGRDMI